LYDVFNKIKHQVWERVLMDFKRIGNRNMGLFFVGKLISVLGSSLFTFVAGLTILNVTGSGSSFAISLICGTLPRVLLAPFAGIVADRMNRRTLLIVSDIAGVVVMLLTFLSILFAPDSLLPIYLSLALLSVCSTFYSVAVSSSLMLMVDREQIQRAGSLNQIASSSGNILAPILGGILYAYLPLSIFTLLNGAAFVVSTVVSVMLVFKPRSVTEAGKADADAADSSDQARSSSVGQTLASIKADLISGFSYVRGKPAVSTLIQLVFWINFFLASLGVLLPYVLVQTLQLPSEQFGTVEAMEAVGVLLMSLIMTIRKQSKDHVRPMVIGLYMLSAMLVAVALPLFFSVSIDVIFVYYMAVMLLIGFSIIIVNIPVSVFMQTTIDEEYRGRVFGLLDTFAGAIVPLGMLTVGYLVDLVPVWILPIISAVAVAMITFFGHRRLREAARSHQPEQKSAGSAGIVHGGEVGV
jgi:MFS family permease